jgi:hypothetical protein
MDQVQQRTDEIVAVAGVKRKRVRGKKKNVKRKGQAGADYSFVSNVITSPTHREGDSDVVRVDETLETAAKKMRLLSVNERIWRRLPIVSKRAVELPLYTVWIKDFPKFVIVSCQTTRNYSRLHQYRSELRSLLRVFISNVFEYVAHYNAGTIHPVPEGFGARTGPNMTMGLGDFDRYLADVGYLATDHVECRPVFPKHDGDYEFDVAQVTPNLIKRWSRAQPDASLISNVWQVFRNDDLSYDFFNLNGDPELRSTSILEARAFLVHMLGQSVRSTGFKNVGEEVGSRHLLVTMFIEAETTTQTVEWWSNYTFGPAEIEASRIGSGLNRLPNLRLRNAGDGDLRLPFKRALNIATGDPNSMDPFAI